MQASAQKSFTGQRTMAGFTIIEVMIVVAIIGILGAIALPSYTEYLTRGKLTEASAILAGHRVKMEQYFQDNRTYKGACDNGSLAATPVETEHFTYKCDADDTTYTVTATGKGPIAKFAYTINQSNVRETASVDTDNGWAKPTTSCWSTRKSGKC